MTVLTAEDVQVRLRLKSRAKALEIIARLPHIDLSRPNALHRTLRITEDTLDAFLAGKIALGEVNVIPFVPPKSGSGNLIPYRKE